MEQGEKKQDKAYFVTIQSRSFVIHYARKAETRLLLEHITLHENIRQNHLHHSPVLSLIITDLIWLDHK
jgi:hypothetical protein